MDIFCKISALAAFSLALALNASTQNQPPDTTIILRAIDVTAIVPPRLMGVRDGRIDSASLVHQYGSDISQVLQTLMPISIKSYGPGTVTTLSIRGTSASHTRVVWNGLPINSPTLGLTDLSSLPAILSDEVELRFGGAGVGLSTGSMGGEIRLNTLADYRYKSSMLVMQGFGSTGSFSTALSAHLNEGKAHANMRLYRSSSQNEYKYHNNSSGLAPYPLEKRTNAASGSLGGMTEIFYLATAKSLIRTGVWFHFADRDIPSSLLVSQIPGNESQTDRSVKIYANIKQMLNKGSIDAQIGLVRDIMHYRQQHAGIHSTSDVNGLVHELNYTLPFSSNQRLRIGEWVERYNVNTQTFLGYQFRTTAGIYASLYGKLLPKLDYFLLVRESFLNARALPVSPSLGFQYRVSPKIPLTLRGNVSRTYRVPTLNDLYWSPGGNPELDPEDGYQSELGMTVSHKKGGLNFVFDADVFMGQIKGWIQWLPHPEYNYWTVRNLRKVESRGVETSFDALVIQRPWDIRFHLHYAYTLSTQAEAAFEGDATVGKQLIYVPMHSGATRVQLERKAFFGFVETPYTGKRYTNADNTRYMPGVMLVNAGLGYRYALNEYKLEITVSSMNLANTDYQVIAWYPMPLRHYSLTILLQRIEL